MSTRGLAANPAALIDRLNAKMMNGTMTLLFSVFVYLGYGHHWMGLGAKADPVDGRINDGIHATRYAATIQA